MHYEDYQPDQTGTYQTGSTQPPKSPNGLTVFLLVLVIVLIGALTILSVMNIKLFKQISGENGGETLAISIFDTGGQDETLSDNGTSAAAQETQEDAISIATTPAAAENVSQNAGLSLQEIYSRNIDSVVSITCTLSGGTSTGTGVVLTADGYIVTNCHVVEGAQSIRILFHDDSVMDAQLVGSDSVSDLAVLRVNALELDYAELGDSSALQVGDAVVAIGDPLGQELRGTMTDGIISAINRDVDVGGRTMNLIQTNAALNSGNSGGPLINCYGQVIGINTMKMVDTVTASGVEGLGFAIPSNTVSEIVNQLISQGYVSGRPSLGITGENVAEFYQIYYGLPAGLYITEVEAGSAAEAAGLKAGDILLTLGDTRITGAEDYENALYSCSPGDTVQITIYRNWRQYTGTVTVSESGK